MDGGRSLVLNAGSSSLKAAVLDGRRMLLSLAVAEIGGAARLEGIGPARPVDAADHAQALGRVLVELAAAGLPLERIARAGHRVVHGGAELTAPARLSPAVLSRIEAAAPLAPLHNPNSLAAIRALAAAAPGLPQAASFDTAFHRTIPDAQRRAALPDRPETAGLVRYGFHGLSYASLVEALPRRTGAPLPRRLLAFHLGNGASACAILEGRSVATTMGYSPLDGLVMGTRAGSLDPEIVLTLAERMGVAAARRLLSAEAGLKGLTGRSDMRALLASDAPTDRAAVALFCAAAARGGAGLIPAMGGLDAIAFTGGIGENAASVRDEIAAGLAWAFGAAPPEVHVVPAAEERLIAREAAAVLAGP